MARVPVWLDVPRNDLGQFVSRQVCVPKAPCVCASPAAQVAASTGTVVVKQTVAEAAKGITKSVAPLAAAFVLAESLHAVVQCSRGKISKDEAIERSVCSAAGGVASVGGAALGAALGTVIFPGVGTAVGGFLGSALGGLAGRWGASKVMA